MKIYQFSYSVADREVYVKQGTMVQCQDDAEHFVIDIRKVTMMGQYWLGCFDSNDNLLSIVNLEHVVEVYYRQDSK